MTAPPKPWERQSAPPSAISTPISAPQSVSSVASSTPPTSVASTSSLPTLPERPSSLAASTLPPSALTVASQPFQQPISSYANAYSSFGNPYSPYSASPYSSTPYSTFSSPYSRFGSPYSSLGSYGAPYPAGSMYPGQPGFEPNAASLTQRVEASTGQTFALLSSLVQTFGSFAQMLESTYMATHSSFFAMLGVADQFTHLRRYLGEVFGVFSLLAWLRGWWRGDRSLNSMSQDFGRFVQSPKGPDGRPLPAPSRKPLVMFLLAAFGLPLLMHKLVKLLSKRPPLPSSGTIQTPLPVPASSTGQDVLDPATLTFARALYPFDTTDAVELPLRTGELVAVLSKLDPVTGVEGEWWRGRTRDGRAGWFPRKWVEIVRKGEDAGPIAAKAATQE